MFDFLDSLSFKDVYKFVTELLQYLQKKWYLLLLAAFLGAAFGFWQIKGVKPIYNASLTFVLSTETTSGKSSSISALVTQFGLDGGGGGGDYSEVESDVDEPPPQQQQQQQQQLQQQQKGGTAATAASRRQGEPDVWQQQQQLQQPVVRPVLGKRPSDENIGPAQGCSSRGSGASRCADNPLMAAAGPGRAALQQAPGRSFIRDAAAASVGFERGKYISSGPDGKGGVATAYQGSSNSGGGGRVSVEARRRGV